MWLISRNEIDAAINCFRRVAKVNGKVVAEETYEKFRAHCKAANVDNRKESATLLDLFRTPRLRKSTLILFFKSYVQSDCLFFPPDINLFSVSLVQDGDNSVLRCHFPEC